MFDVPDEILKQFRETDVMMPSFPRSGSTWTRLMLADIILQMHGVRTNPNTVHGVAPDRKRLDTDTQQQKVLVYNWLTLNVYEVDLEGVDPSLDLPFRLIMSHYLYNPALGFKTIYLFRNPFDSLCSYYHLCVSHKYFGDTIPSIDEFCQGKGLDDRNPLDDYCNHLNGYMSFKESSPDLVYLASYESLSDDVVSVLMGISKFLGFDIDPHICQKAASNSEFKNLLFRQAKAIENGTQQSIFFRKGKVNTGKSELNNHSIALIQERAMPIYQEALNLEAKESRTKISFPKTQPSEHNQTVQDSRSETDSGLDLPSRVIFLRLENEQQSARITQLESKLNGVALLENTLQATTEELHLARESLQHSRESLLDAGAFIEKISRDLNEAKMQLQQNQLQLQHEQEQITHLNTLIEMRNEEIKALNQRLTNARNLISSMKQSKFWRLREFFARLKN